MLTVNTTDTEYLLQSQDCQLTHYQVEIAAVNVVGVGDKYKSPPLPLDGEQFHCVLHNSYELSLLHRPHSV